MQTKPIAVRFAENDLQRIGQLVGAGFASTTTDYIRRAVREQIIRDADRLTS